MSSNKKNVLGRGLSALLENPETDITTKVNGVRTGTPVAGGIATIPVSQIEANPFQPRTHFEETALLQLSESIREHGIIQPVTVRKMGYDKYQLISGERRFRALQLAGLEEIPAFVRVANDQAMLEMAIVENIQRENLDAIEVAISYKRLMEECDLTQEELGKKVSKDRTTVTNYLRLLKLPSDIQIGIRDKKISMGHARTLINIDSEVKQLEIYNAILDGGLSVRQTEELSKTQKTAQKTTTTTTTVKKEETPTLSFRHQKIADDLRDTFDTTIDFKVSEKGKGKITIPFDSEKELERILAILDV